MKLYLFRYLLLILATASSAITYASDDAREVWSIGVIAPLTLGNAKFGEDIKNAVEIVVSQLNSRTTSRHSYKVIVEDGKCGSGNAAISAANKLIKIDAVDALVVGCSGEILQIADTIEKNKIPTMVVFASHPRVKHLGPYVFRVFMDLDRDIPKVAQKIKEDGRRRVAILTEELPFTLGIKDVLKKELKETLVTAPDYSEGSNDFRSILLRIKKDNPDALFLNAASVETLGPMVKQIHELKMQLPLYSFAYPSVPTFINQYAQFAEGIIFLSPPHINETTEVSAQFRSAFLKHAGRAPNVPFVAATAYDGATALTSALELSSRKESTKTINVLNDYDSHGVLGRIRFDSNGDAIGINYQLQTIRNGAMKPLP